MNPNKRNTGNADAIAMMSPPIWKIAGVDFAAKSRMRLYCDMVLSDFMYVQARSQVDEALLRNTCIHAPSKLI